MKAEKIITPLNGYFVVALVLVSMALTLYSFTSNNGILGVASFLIFIFLTKGFVVVSPNSSKVLLLFGEYKGSVKQSGFFWINPLSNRTSLSLRARNFESEKIKVNDK